jgi:hypothetical protein
MIRPRLTGRVTTMVSILVLAGATQVGCSGAGAGGPTDDSNADQSTQSAHLLAVQACDKAKDQDLPAATSADAQVQAVTKWQTCLAAANDESVAVIESNLAGSDAQGKTQSRVKAYRDGYSLLCVPLSLFLHNQQQFLQAGCEGQGERVLASELDALVKYTPKAALVPVSDADIRAALPACYMAFDGALAKAQGDADKIAALGTLAGCIDADDPMQVQLESLFILQMQGELSADMLAGLFDSGLKAIRAAQADECASLVAQTQPASAQPLAAAQCKVDVAAQVHTQLAQQVSDQ